MINDNKLRISTIKCFKTGHFLYNNNNSTFLRFLMDGTTFPL